MKKITQEGIFLAFLFAVFLSYLGPSFLRGEVTSSHDNLYWNFPLFHFFAEALHNGELPLWNPYTHGGEPFFPMLGQMRLFDPAALLSVLLGQYFTKNITALFNWQRILQLFILFTGTYALIRRSTELLPIRFLLAVLILFSSVTLSTFRSDGILHQYLWVPWVLFFLIRIFIDEDLRTKNFVALAVVLGINFQTYFFVGPWLLVCCFIGFSLYAKREVFLRILKTNSKKIALVILIQAVMALPLLVTYWGMQGYIFPNRSIPSDFLSGEKNGGSYVVEGKPEEISHTVGMSFQAMEFSGTFVRPGDFLQFFRPSGYDFFSAAVKGVKPWGDTSDVYLYLGLVPLILILLGLFWAAHPLKPLFLIITAFFVLFAMGPRGGIYSVLFLLSPVFQVVRNAGYLALYFQLGLLFFVGLGADYVWRKQPSINFRCSRAGFWMTFFGSIFVSLLLLGLIKVPYPWERYSCLGIMLLVLTLKYIEKNASRGSVFYVILISLFFNLLVAHPNKTYVFIFSLIGLLIPLALYTLWSLKKEVIGTPFLFLSIVSLFLIDLAFHAERVSLLFEEKSPSHFFRVNPNLQPAPVLGAMRSSLFSPTRPGIRTQAVRYPEVILREQAILSAPRGGYDFTSSFKRILPKPRWDYYLLSESLHSLIYSPTNALVLEELLGLRNDYFEFRSKASFAPLSKPLPKEWETRLKNEIIYSEGEFPAGETAGSGNSFSFKILSFARNRVLTEVNAGANGYLLWRNGFDSFWNATLDGEPVSLFRANFHQTGIPLKKGRHLLELKYEPTLFVWVGALFVLCYLLGFVYYVSQDLLRLVKLEFFKLKVSHTS